MKRFQNPLSPPILALTKEKTLPLNPRLRLSRRATLPLSIINISLHTSIIPIFPIQRTLNLKPFNVQTEENPLLTARLSSQSEELRQHLQHYVQKAITSIVRVRKITQTSQFLYTFADLLLCLHNKIFEDLGKYVLVLF